MRLFFARYLFPIIILLLSISFIFLGIRPGKPGTLLFLMAGLVMFVTAVIMILLSANIIRGKGATILALLLVPVIGVFVYFNYTSINSDIQFTSQSKERYNTVKKRLEVIRAGQLAYKERYKDYAKDFNTLVDFIKNGKMRILRMDGNADDSLAVAKGLVKRDTIEIPVIGSYAFSFPGYPIDSIAFIPYGNGEKFDMKTDYILGEGGDSTNIQPAIMVSANFQVFMKSLGEKFDKTIPDSLIKVGSLTEPTTNGNWR